MNTLLDVNKKKTALGVIIHYTPSKGSSINAFNSEKAAESWEHSFSFIKEDISTRRPGLRTPQLGAIYSALSHWELTNEPATIVMPTGTGKTEVMLSLLILCRCKKLLVIVPTDALRKQIAEKFAHLGKLIEMQIIKTPIIYPVVGIMEHKPHDEVEIKEMFEICNVIITTMSIVGNIHSELQLKISNYCSHLFIDEAHHIAADTWKSFKGFFSPSKILQFTATPFRNDGKIIEDKIIFNYPLRKAQEDGYYKEINFISIEEWDKEKHDETIAKAAIKQLRNDISRGYDHILMARVDSIYRADEIFKYYSNEPDLKAISLNSKTNNKKEIREKIIKGYYKIIICVDMLGEGFDLPQLKIAAFHDIKKSLPITLQVVGRFTRDDRDKKLGKAAVIVNIAMAETSMELEELYASDADWNLILPSLSSGAIRSQIELQEFLKGFKNFPDKIQLQNIFPALSSVVYKTDSDTWYPNNYKKGIEGIEKCDQIYDDINSEKRVLVIVCGKKNNIVWGNIDNIYELNWSLIVVYWYQDKQLLFINSSENLGNYSNLAKSVTNDKSILIDDASVYKSLSNISQLKMNTVGLKNPVDKLLSYSQHMGSDVAEAMSSSQSKNRIKSNVFCTGYEDGEKISIGCSRKGRIWSRKTSTLKGLIDWCKRLGEKLLDANVNPEIILKDALVPERISKRPDTLPISIQWNESLFTADYFDKIAIIIDDKNYDAYTFDLVLYEPYKKGNIKFKLICDKIELIFELKIYEKGGIKKYEFNNLSSHSILIKIGKNTIKLESYFHEKSPIIRFIDGSWLEGNSFVKYQYSVPEFDVNDIITWEWDGVDIRKESQDSGKITDSIQFKVISELKKEDKYNILFDDDGSGEIADVIAIDTDDTNKLIHIHLFHLKYSHSDTPGSRINDIYELCGQAQKSVYWKGKSNTAIFERMLLRCSKDIKKIEKGSKKEIGILKEKSKRAYITTLDITVVQPGISKSKISREMLELLGVTANYLKETYRINLNVIGSE